ncbi:TorF family putative porin [Pseudooceanicola sp. C21-150M6]|uniref:TorF family putative porin n=1 Tax=Pseudooceanicola sp. C21-150M6 TaxID=3434355 RepID=UPI003D7F2654
MHALLKSSALSVLLGLPTLTAAQDFSLSSGVTLTSRYVSNGLEQTTGAALQPWVELGYGGFYLGTWASNTDDGITGSDYEIDVYAGFRNEVGKFSYDVGYARYYYTSPYVDCCGEFILSTALAPVEPLSLGLRFAYDPDADVLNSKISADYTFDKITFGAAYGTINNGGHEYWSAGASYALSDMFSVSGTWHDSSIAKGLAVVSLDASF